MEAFQYNAAPATLSVARDFSKEKLYQDLGLEYLKFRDRIRNICIFYKKIIHRLSLQVCFNR